MKQDILAKSFSILALLAVSVFFRILFNLLFVSYLTMSELIEYANINTRKSRASTQEKYM